MALRKPPSSWYSPSICAHWSSSSTLTFCVPKTQSSPCPATVPALVLPSLKSGALPLPLSFQEAPPPMCSSITSWVGVVPTPRELPSLVLKLSASLALNLPSRLTNSVLAFAPGREIMS